MLHRVREVLNRQRTMPVNALRSHLAVFGIVTRQGMPARGCTGSRSHPFGLEPSAGPTIGQPCSSNICLQPGSHQRPGYWSCYFAGRGGGTLHQARGQMTDHQARKVGALKGSSAFATMRSLAMRFNGILARARARTPGDIDRRRHQFRSRFHHALRARAAARYRCRLQCN